MRDGSGDEAERGMAASKASRPSRHPGWTATDATSSMCMSSIYGAPATSASAWHRAASTPFKDHSFKDPGLKSAASWHDHHEVVCWP